MGMSRPATASTSSISNDLVCLRARSSALILINRDLTDSPDPAQALQGRPKPSASNSFYESIHKLSKILLINVKWHLRHNTRVCRQNDSQIKAECVYFRAPHSTRHLRQLNSNRKDTTVSLIWPGRDAEVHNRFACKKLLEPLGASSEWQSQYHMCQNLAQMAPHHWTKCIALLRPDKG